MFLPRSQARVVPQKNRNNRISRPDWRWASPTWFRVVAVGQGHLAKPMVERLFIWAKRLVRHPNTLARFWVNIQVCQVVTKKAANTRMGKGKGSRVAVVGKVSSGTTLLAVSRLRSGLISKVVRQIQVRCHFRVAALYASRDLDSQTYLALKQTQRRYVALKRRETLYLYRRANQIHTLAFFSSLFRWSYRRPVLRTWHRYLYLSAPSSYSRVRFFLKPVTPLVTVAAWTWSLELDDDVLDEEDINLEVELVPAQLFKDVDWGWLAPEDSYSVTELFAYVFSGHGTLYERQATLFLNLAQKNWIMDYQHTQMLWVDLLTFHQIQEEAPYTLWSRVPSLV